MQSETGLPRLFRCSRKGAVLQRTLIVLVAWLAAAGMSAAENERVIVELTQPDQPGLLRINHYKGSITVHAYDGKTVIARAAYREYQSSDGLQRLNQRSTGLSAVEQNNEVTIHTDSQRRTVDLTVLVPKYFSLKLQTYDNGEIEVTDVCGEMDITNTNGPVRLFRISGSAVLTTVDGDILVKFAEIEPDMPMAFTSIEGNIDITFPASADGRLKMKADNGDIFTDGSITVNGESPAEKKPEGYTAAGWSIGKLNRGGAEFLIKSLNGNIYVRKNKSDQ